MKGWGYGLRIDGYKKNPCYGVAGIFLWGFGVVFSYKEVNLVGAVVKRWADGVVSCSLLYPFPTLNNFVFKHNLPRVSAGRQG